MDAGQTRRVALVVEDELFIRDLIVSELAARGWSVLQSETGEAAVERFRSAHVDILFTDIQLAGRMSGWDVADTLRATRPGLPVIYTSARAADDSRQVRGALFFDKPYDPEAVIDACHALLSEAD